MLIAHFDSSGRAQNGSDQPDPVVDEVVKVVGCFRFEVGDEHAQASFAAARSRVRA
jgi:hypothetical protein